MPNFKVQHEPVTFVAGASMASQALYSCVQLHTTEGQVVVAAAKDDIVLGVTLNQPASGGGLLVQPCIDGDIIPMVCSAAIALGAEVTATAAGQVVTNDSTTDNFVIGIATEATSNANEQLGVLCKSKNQE